MSKEARKKLNMDIERLRADYVKEQRQLLQRIEAGEFSPSFGFSLQDQLHTSYHQSVSELQRRAFLSGALAGSIGSGF